MTLSLRRAATVPPYLIVVVVVLVGAGFMTPAPASAAAQPGVWPLQPRPEVVHGFAPPSRPWLPGHRGLDLAGAPGQPVLAAAAGTITYAGRLAGRGVVVVSHGSHRTTYEPVLASARSGARVRAGQVIGRLSAAGSHCAPAACLHWGLRRGDDYLDPRSLVGGGRVRLLPLGAPLPADDSAPSLAHDKERDGVSPTAPGGAKAGASPAAGIVVGLAALLSVGGGLMVRRH